jgi:hypothetical protein
MIADTKLSPLSELQCLLEKQIQAAMKNDFKTVEKLAEQTENKIQQLLKGDFQKSPDFEKQHKYVLGLYKKLDLIIAGEKATLLHQQKLVDKVRKTLSVYGKNG